MQITANTTGMAAGLSVSADVEARDHLVIVVKGNFSADVDGSMSLCAEQPEPCAVDEHHGDPARTSVRYANDFALYKPRAEVLVDGHAFAPEGGGPVRELAVALEVDGRRKQALVSGERVWVRTAGSFAASPPVPFSQIPLRFERAYGGPLDPRNPVGVGHHPNAAARELDGTPVPNLEAIDARVTRPNLGVQPIGFGPLGPAWQPRLRHAGTYDARWRAQRCPFLPEDFDARFFLCAPEDQQFPFFRGGEQIRCYHMAPQPVVSYVLPRIEVPVRVRFGVNTLSQARLALLDTVILQPHLARAQLVWRTSVPLGKKLNTLREVIIGELPDARGLLGYREGKPHFRDLSAALRWIRSRREGRTR
ncbi:MAG: DUF2169 domain-containing protein [Enhygromyxa sp.]